MFNLIIFDNTGWEENKPHKCYRVGVRNCISITENIIEIENDDGLLCCSYIVKFRDGSEVEIRDTIYVSD